jgi:hypothetical protein
MIRGIRVRADVRSSLAAEVSSELKKREDFLQTVLGHTINPRSSPQMQKLFYSDLGQPPVMSRAKKGKKSAVTCDDEALQKIAAREPLLKPLINAIADIRTLGIFRNTFILGELDEDGRMRCSFNIGGSESGKSAPKTYRLSSSENAFGRGVNLQTIPSEKSRSVNKAAARGGISFLGDPYQLPNIRSMFGPDPGYTMFDMDLDRADIQAMAWDADEPLLKAALRKGVDIHLLNAFVISGQEPPPLEELVESHPKYPDHRGPRKAMREFAKTFAHACVTGDHEVLTPQGWKRIDEVTDEEEIAVWAADIHFECPEGWHRDLARAGEELVYLRGQAFDQLVTADHKLPFTTMEEIVCGPAREVVKLRSARLPKSGYYSGPDNITDAALVAAFIADGTVDSRGNVRFHFHKERKKERLRGLLQDYTYSESADSFYIPHRSAAFTRYGKEYGPWLLTLSESALDTILAEQEFWDGSRGPSGAVVVSSVNRDSLEWLRTAAHLRGKASQYQGAYISSFGSLVHRCSLNNRPFASIASMQCGTVVLNHPVNVYCPKTSTGFFLVRRNGKISVTGNTDYLGRPRTVAAATGRTVHEIDRAQKVYLGTYSGIARWQKRVIEQVQRYRFVENVFGYRWYIFDRIDDSVMPEAVAWGPQSVVSIVINRIWMQIFQGTKELNLDPNFLWSLMQKPQSIEVLLQVHDSLVGQFPTHRAVECLAQLRELSQVVVPFDDPLVIPTGIGTSEVSWGEC